MENQIMPIIIQRSIVKVMSSMVFDHQYKVKNTPGLSQGENMGAPPSRAGDEMKVSMKPRHKVSCGNA